MRLKVLVLVSLTLALLVSFLATSKLNKNDNGFKKKINFSDAKSLKNYCKDQPDCYKNSIALYLENHSVEDTLKLLNETSEITNGLYNDCHNISHSVGQLAYKKIGKEALSLHENACQWGFGHGVLLSASQDLKAEEFVENFKKFCELDPEPIGCLHGIGHALGDKKTKASFTMEICYSIGSDIDGRKERDLVSKSSSGACVEGWVMQQLGTLEYNSMKSPDEAGDVCEGMEGEALFICKGMSIRNYVIIATNSLDKFKRVKEFKNYCNNFSPNSENLEIYECGRYLAEALDDIVIPDNKFNTKFVADNINNTCEKNFIESCVISFTNYQINRNNSDYSNMLEVCKLLEKSRKEYCLKTISNRTNIKVEELLK